MLSLTSSGCGSFAGGPGSEIEATIPEHEEADVAIETKISITFKEAAVPGSVLLGVQPDFEYEQNWSDDNTTITLTPSQNLQKSTRYLVTLRFAAFEDQSLLNQPVSFSFDTLEDESKPPAPLALSPDNIETVESISDSMDQLIARGVDPGTICTQVAEMFEDDENVGEAGVDEENNAVWVEFSDGEVQVFQVAGEDSAGWGDVPEDAFRFGGSGASSRSRRPAGKRSAVAKADATPHYLPANNKALLANALQSLHPEIMVNNSTDDIEEMLTERGYDVTRHALTLDDFKHLGDYGVVFLETHGVWRKTASFNAALDALSTQHVLLTTTRITDENYPPDIYDISKDRTSLVSWTVKESHLTVNGVNIVFTIRNYGVTAEYVREQAVKFTDKTILFLNGCSSLSDDVVNYETVSPFKDVFFEKCDKGPLFVGWNGKTSFFAAVRAALNFFQYATASNRDVRALAQDKSGKWAEAVLLKKSAVPWGGYNMTAQAAYEAIKTQSFTTGGKFKGTLALFTEGTDAYDNIFMPHPRVVDFDEDGDHSIDMIADTSPEVTVGGAKCTLTPDPDYADTWDIKMPVGAYGDLVVTENLRKSIPRKVYRWMPKIKIQGNWMNSDGQLQYAVNLSLQARATVSEESLRMDPLEDPPEAGFETEWDKTASSISWQSSGEFVNGSKTTTLAGSGLRNFDEWDEGVLEFSKDTGLLISCSISIAEKETHKEPLGTFTYDQSRGISFYRYSEPGEATGVTSDWTVDAQSFDTYEGWNDLGLDTVISEMISWNVFSSDPSFDGSLEPR